MAENRDTVWERSRWHLHNGRLEESLVKGQTVHKSVGSSEGTGKGFAAKTVNHTHLHLRQEVPSTPERVIAMEGLPRGSCGVQKRNLPIASLGLGCERAGGMKTLAALSSYPPVSCWNLPLAEPNPAKVSH